MRQKCAVIHLDEPRDRWDVGGRTYSYNTERLSGENTLSMGWRHQKPKIYRHLWIWSYCLYHVCRLGAIGNIYLESYRGLRTWACMMARGLSTEQPRTKLRSLSRDNLLNSLSRVYGRRFEESQVCIGVAGKRSPWVLCHNVADTLTGGDPLLSLRTTQQFFSIPIKRDIQSNWDGIYR